MMLGIGLTLLLQTKLYSCKNSVYLKLSINKFYNGWEICMRKWKWEYLKVYMVEERLVNEGYFYGLNGWVIKYTYFFRFKYHHI